MEDVLPLYIRFRDGIPGDLGLYRSRIGAYVAQRDQFFGQVDSIKSSSNWRCQTFLNTFQSVNDQAILMMRDLAREQDENPKMNMYFMDPLRVARLQILISISSRFRNLLQQDSEAGEGFLEDKNSRTQCVVPQREIWKQQGIDLIKGLTSSALALTGVPGISDMETMETGLTRKIQKKERDNTHRRWTEMAVGTIVSIGIWRLAPMIGLRYFTRVPFFRTHLGFWVIKFFGIGAELVAFRYADRHAILVEDSVINDQTQHLSWDDYMVDVRAALRSEVNSPRFYYDVLTKVYGRISSSMLAVLAPWADQLRQLEQQSGTIDRAIQQQHFLQTAVNYAK